MEEVNEYNFIDWDNNKIKLSELFGDKDELILIHNMGKECTYCTMWADGFNGVLKHLEDRASFVVVSPDQVESQKEFARGRNWKFRMVSAQGTSFVEEMGFGNNEKPEPGVSTFGKKDGKIFRANKDSFGPGDKYCGVWHLFDLLPKGKNDWEPRFKY